MVPSYSTPSPMSSRFFWKGPKMWILPQDFQTNQNYPRLLKTFIRCLASYAYYKPSCDISHATMVKWTGYSLRSIIKAQKLATELQLVKVKRRYRKTNVYTLLCLEEKLPLPKQGHLSTMVQSCPQKEILEEKIITVKSEAAPNPENPATKLPQPTPESPKRNGIKYSEPAKACVELVASDVAATLEDTKSLKMYMKAVWRLGYDAVYECCSWVKGEYEQGRVLCRGSLFLWRLRTYYGVDF